MTILYILEDKNFPNGALILELPDITKYIQYHICNDKIMECVMIPFKASPTYPADTLPAPYNAIG